MGPVLSYLMGCPPDDSSMSEGMHSAGGNSSEILRDQSTGPPILRNALHRSYMSMVLRGNIRTAQSCGGATGALDGEGNESIQLSIADSDSGYEASSETDDKLYERRKARREKRQRQKEKRKRDEMDKGPNPDPTLKNNGEGSDNTRDDNGAKGQDLRPILGLTVQSPRKTAPILHTTEPRVT